MIIFNTLNSLNLLSCWCWSMKALGPESQSKPFKTPASNNHITQYPSLVSIRNIQDKRLYWLTLYISPSRTFGTQHFFLALKVLTTRRALRELLGIELSHAKHWNCSHSRPLIHNLSSNSLWKHRNINIHTYKTMQRRVSSQWRCERCRC